MRNATTTGFVLASILLAGCSSTSGLFGGSSSTAGAGASASANAGSADNPNFGDKVMNFFNTGMAAHPKVGGVNAPDDIDCPSVTVRDGASTWTVNGPGEPSPLTLRYQGDIGRLARECRVVGKTTMVMKVGMQGRIILGPQGGPGKVVVPLRFAVVKEGPVPQTVVTRSYKKEVDIPPGVSNVPFLQIDDNISFLIPASLTDLDDYVVYVGYDPQALAPPPRKPLHKKPRARKLRTSQH